MKRFIRIESQYYYDPFGRRLWKEVGGVRTYFVYADEGLVAEVDAAGNVVKSYGYRPGSTWSTDPLFMKQGSEYYFYHSDHLGISQKMTAVNGAVIWSAKYSSFRAREVNPASTVINNLRLPGQYYDQETGLHYNYHRYYDPVTGRYLRPDPIGLAGGINLYSYTANNPINAIDPLGLDLILVGQGGDSGAMFHLTAKTWANENPGSHQIVPVNTGKEAIAAMENYAKNNNGIEGLRYFGHSGRNGLYFDQSSGYASLYSGGAGWWYSWIKPDASRIGEIDPSLFNDDATVGLYGCNTANGEDSFAEKLANHLGIPVTGSQSGNSFSGKPNGRPGEGLPNPVPRNYTPVYLVPEGKGWKTFPGK